MGGCGELAHVETDLGDDDLRGSLGDAGDLVESFDHPEPVVGIVADDRDVIGRRWWRVGWVRVGERVDRSFDAGGKTGDVRGAGVDLVQQQPGEVGVVGVEATVERLDERRSFRGSCAGGPTRPGPSGSVHRR
jgi:hypothetical protein